MEKIVSEKYIKGFNQSYLITKYRPKLIEMLLKNVKDNDFFKGMQDGRKTYIQEKNKSKSLSKSNSRLQELERLRSSKREVKDRGLER